MYNFVELSRLGLKNNRNTIHMEAKNASTTSSGNVLSPDLPLSSSPLPVLNHQLNSLYSLLDDDMKHLFIKMYRFLWDVVRNYNVKHSGIVSYYWLVYGAAESSGLPPSSFVVLSYLYMMTNKGNKHIHSYIVHNSGCLPNALPISVGRVLWDLKHAGYITRHTKDPGQPYVHRAQHNKQRVYIKMTDKGVRLIEGIEKDVYKTLLNTSLNDLTAGVNKKPG
jgi:hypothetical protein